MSVANTTTLMSGSLWTTTSLGALLVLSVIAVGIGLGVLAIWLRRWWSAHRLAHDDAEVDVEAAARVCPSCSRRYPADARFCAVDATPLSWVEGAVVEACLACPRCEHVYDSGVRFCPLDAEELVRADFDPDSEKRDAHHLHDLSGQDMICPVCAERYVVAAAYCGRDGTRLCPLN